MFGPRKSLAFLVLALAVLFGGVTAPALATCLPVASAPTLSPHPYFLHAGFSRAAIQGPVLLPGRVALSYLGHSSFLIRTPQNVTAITDYNGVEVAGFPPDIVTMNHAHDSHYTDFVEPGVRHILRGWMTLKGYPRHNVTIRDMRVRNVATNIRTDFDASGTEIAGNSIFIFETNGLCLAHLGHLHHALTPSHLGRIGQVDVVMAPVDGGMTLNHDEMAKAIKALKPKMVVPMHVFGLDSLAYFTTLMRDQGYVPLRVTTDNFQLSRNVLRRK
ncbi:MAG: MBL fold metallo-hydrolase, partial [Rhodospirillales bacterium]|nr:MBL fold metallo-hydrolase [Rhodospirillales bacterium]